MRRTPPTSLPLPKKKTKKFKNRLHFPLISFIESSHFMTPFPLIRVWRHYRWMGIGAMATPYRCLANTDLRSPLVVYLATPCTLQHSGHFLYVSQTDFTRGLGQVEWYRKQSSPWKNGERTEKFEPFPIRVHRMDLPPHPPFDVIRALEFLTPAGVYVNSRTSVSHPHFRLCVI